MEGGKRLRPAGGRILTEVFIGLIQADGKSFLTQQPDWKPKLPTVDPDIYVAFLAEFHQYYDIGPCRIMGEWPASRPEVGVP